MKNVLLILILSFPSSLLFAQLKEMKWHSTSENNGIIIQNSLNRGGKFEGDANARFNQSYLVYFVRINNTTKLPIKLNFELPVEPISIPDVEDTFVELLLPQEEMSVEKYHSHSYGIKDLTFAKRTKNLSKRIDAGEDYHFYVASIFFQTKDTEWQQDRGGNRIELLLEKQELMLNMLPQVNKMPVGKLTSEYVSSK